MYEPGNREDRVSADPPQETASHPFREPLPDPAGSKQPAAAPAKLSPAAATSILLLSCGLTFVLLNIPMASSGGATRSALTIQHERQAEIDWAIAAAQAEETTELANDADDR